MKTLLRILRDAGLVALFSAAGAGLAAVAHPEWLKIGSIRLELAPGSDEAQLFQRIRADLAPKLAALEGRFFWRVPLAEVQAASVADKRVKTVNVFREFPSALRVEVEPYTPILAFLGDDGRVYPLATDATLLPAIGARDVPDLPLLRGEDLKADERARAEAIELWRAMPDEGAFTRDQVSEITYTKKDGFRIFIGGASVEVRFGEGDFAPKISRVTKVVSYLQSQNIKGRVIDARFNKKVVVRVRKRP